MRLLAISMLCGAVPWCGSAQISATALPGGTIAIHVHDDRSLPLAAYAVRAEFQPESSARAPVVFYSDSAVDADVSPLGPGEERVVERGVIYRAGAQRTGELSVRSAAVFADGTTSGDAALLEGLMTRRRAMLQAVEAALAMIESAGKRNVPRGQLIGQFRVMEDSVYHWYLPLEQQVGRSVYRATIEKLEALPEGPLGTPFPPDSFVDEERAALNRQRAVLADSRPNLTGLR